MIAHLSTIALLALAVSLLIYGLTRKERE